MNLSVFSLPLSLCCLCVLCDSPSVPVHNGSGPEEPGEPGTTLTATAVGEDVLLGESLVISRDWCVLQFRKIDFVFIALCFT